MRFSWIRLLIIGFSGRKLTWLWQFSRNELRTLYTTQKYFFVTSSFQACVLLQFNSGGDSLSYSDIEVGTGMSAETLKPVLQLLLKQRVIELKDENYELNLGKLQAFHRVGMED